MAINLVSLDDALIEAEDFAIAILSAAEGIQGEEMRGLRAIADHHLGQIKAIRQQVTDTPCRAAGGWPMNTPELPADGIGKTWASHPRIAHAYSDLEEPLLDLERLVRIVQILLEHDLDQLDQRPREMLSRVALDQLEEMTKDLVTTYYRAGGQDEKWQRT